MTGRRQSRLLASTCLLSGLIVGEWLGYPSYSKSYSSSYLGAIAAQRFPSKATPALVAQAQSGADSDPESGTADSLARQQQAADAALNRATTLFVVLLGTLIVLLGVGVVMLWLLRRSVVREVAEVVRGQLNEMTDLEGKIQAAGQDLDSILRTADQLSKALDQQTDRFSRDVGEQGTTRQRERALDSLQQAESQIADRLAQINSASQKARDVLDGVSRQADQALTDRVSASTAGFERRLEQLGQDALAQRDRILAELEALKTDFPARLTGLQTEAEAQIERQREETVASLQQQQTDISAQLDEIQASTFGHKELALKNIEQAIKTSASSLTR